MKKTLKPFQTTGADFLANRRTALLADEMGLGKTVQALAAVEKINSQKNVVICPAGVRNTWRREIFENGLPPENFLVASYESAVKMAASGLDFSCDTLILDEAHYLKTPESQRTQALFANKTGLARGAKRVWALTGTPALNRPRELYPILKTMGGSKILGGYDTVPKFAQRYCGAFFDGYGLNTKGASHIDELAEKLKGFMLRRTKKEVLPELPPVITNYIPLDIPKEKQRPIFDVESEIANREEYLSSTHEDYAQLGDLARLARVTGEVMAPYVAGYVRELLETVDKVVVFFRHRNVMASLIERLSSEYGIAILHGGLTDIQRAQEIETFKNSTCRVLLGQIQVAGTGINGLQDKCSDVVFAELTWVPGETDQAVGRLHRIGQLGEAVNVHIPVVEGTLINAMVEVQRNKRAVIERLMRI